MKRAKRLFAGLLLCLLCFSLPAAAGAETQTGQTPLPVPSATPAGLCGARYWPDAFSYDGRVYTDEHAYVSDQVDIRVTTVTNNTTFNRRITYVLADIRLQDVRSFRTAWAGDSPLDNKKTKTIKEFDAQVDPILSMNGDYIAAKKFGIVVRNGEVFRAEETRFYDICALMKNGELRIFEGDSFTVEEVLAYDPWQVWCFGPSLLDEDGNPKTTFQSNLTGANPRAVLGYYEPGHYCFVVVDGRRKGYSDGLNMKQLSRLMASLGCRAAYNMDGGASAQIRFLGTTVNKPSGYRKIPDILNIAEPPDTPLPEDWTAQYIRVAGTPKPTPTPTPRPTPVG